MALNARVVKKSLKHKGFEKEKSRDHEFYFYFHRGKKSDCWVKFSSSHSTLDNSLLTSMTRTLHLDSSRQTRD